jgi:hypothetical protein
LASCGGTACGCACCAACVVSMIVADGTLPRILTSHFDLPPPHTPLRSIEMDGLLRPPRAVL